MQRRVFHAAVVPVNRHPFFQRLHRSKGIRVLRIRVAEKIPGRTCPLRHGIGFTPCRSAADRACGIDPIRNSCQRRLAVFSRFVAFDIRQQHRELVIRHRNIFSAVITPDQRNRFAPVTLTGKHPVAKLIIDFFCTLAGLRQFRNDSFLRLWNCQAVQETGIDHHAGFAVGKGRFVDIAAGNDFDNRQIEFFGKCIVAVIMCRNRHNGTRAVGHQDIVRDKDRNFAAIDRVDRCDAVQADTGLFLRKFCTFKVTLSGGNRTVCHHIIDICYAILVFVQHRVFR